MSLLRRRGWLIGAVTAVVIGLVCAVGVLAASVIGSPEHFANVDPSTSGSSTLTTQVAAGVLDDYKRAEDTQDADLFSTSTCASFIADDISRRGVNSVEGLLSAYQKAKQYVPVQSVADLQVVSAAGSAPDGSVTVSATITDNRFVPPTTARRDVVMAMRFEDGRWKVCPSLDPL